MSYCLFDLLNDPSVPIKSPSCPKEEQRIADNLEALRAILDVRQRKLLLSIVDDLHMMIYETAREQYAAGFRMATCLLIESLYIPHRDTP